MRAFLLLVVGFAVAADDPKTGTIQSQLKALQGTWNPTALESGGMKASAEQLKTAAGNLEVKGDKITLEIWSSVTTAELKLDPEKKPKAMDLLHNGKAGTLAIYELDGDTLRICFQVEDGRPRPREFTSKDAFIIVSYKRAKR